MNIDELLSAGNDILEDVMQAVNTNNYNGLGKKIGDRVREVVQDGSTQNGGPQKSSRQSGSGGQQPYSRNAGPQYRQQSGARQYTGQPYQQQGGAWQNGGRQNNMRQMPQNTGSGFGRALPGRSHFLLKRVGRGGPTARTVFGGIGLLAFGVPAIVCLAELIMIGGGAMLAGTIIFGLLTAGAGWLLHSGIRGSRLVSRYYAYGKQLGDAEYVSIPELAAQTGMKEKQVRKDLLEMMHKGYLPQAKMDTQQKTLILTDEAYGLYRQAENSRLQRAAQEEAQKQAADVWQRTAGTGQKKNAAGTRETKEIRDILDRGNAYIRKVRDVNDMIPDTEEMSAKLYRLEEITHRIFEQVKKQPESAAGLRRFMDYYLPTTEKLLDAYVELDKQPVSGENIRKTKQEIDEAMDVINDAFENLLNSMFENMAWDISSDISVMKTMMAQDGLTEQERRFGVDFGQVKKKEKVPVYADSSGTENSSSGAERAERRL